MTKHRSTGPIPKSSAKNTAKRSTKTRGRTESTLNHSLGPEQPGLLMAHYGGTLIVESHTQQLFRCHSRQNIGPLVTGDEVIWQQIDEGTGIVVAGLPRRSIIMRPDFRAQPKPMAANVDHMIIVIAWEPLPQQTTLDRYLILAESLGLKAIIVINKADIAHDHQQSDLVEHLKIYQTLGYPWLEVSSKTGRGLATLQQLLKNANSILVGQSGVGKSSLLSGLVPNAKVQIRELSKSTRLGRHTTTASQLYHLPTGGNIIDSPGIHRFRLHHLSVDLITQGFKEFRPFLGRCKFRNCLHQNEPACALLAALADGQISSFRFQNYQTLIAELAE